MPTVEAQRRRRSSSGVGWTNKPKNGTLSMSEAAHGDDGERTHRAATTIFGSQPHSLPRKIVLFKIRFVDVAVSASAFFPSTCSSWKWPVVGLFGPNTAPRAPLRGRKSPARHLRSPMDLASLRVRGRGALEATWTAPDCATGRKEHVLRRRPSPFCKSTAIRSRSGYGFGLPTSLWILFGFGLVFFLKNLYWSRIIF